MEQLQIKAAVCFSDRYDLFGIKLLVISAADAVLQLLFRIICQKTAQNRICHLMVVHLSQCRKRKIQCRNLLRYIQTAVLSQSL